MSRKPDFSGKTVVIAGASSGIGRGAALGLGELGAHVAVIARRSRYLDDLAAEIIAQGGSALAVETDVSDQAGWPGSPMRRLIDSAG